MTDVDSLRPVAVLLVAFVASVGVVAGRRQPVVRDGVPVVAAAVSFGLVASMLPTVLAGEVPTTHLGTFVPGVALEFRADPLGVLFALVVTGLWLPTAIYSSGYTHGKQLENVTRYNAALCLSLGSGLGVAFAGNLLVLVVFYELTTVGTYPLVAHAGTDRARRVGLVYVGYVIGGGTAVLFGSVVVFLLAGTADFVPGGIPALVEATTTNPAAATVAIGSLLAGFGVKGAVMPLHAWLPDAMVAPTPVSGVLHAVVVVKSGVFGIARTVLETFGPEATAALGVDTPLAAVAAATIVLGSLLALRQDDLKRRLAYSTVAQLSYVVLGIALLVPAAVIGGLVHIAAHAVAKLTLFCCVGVVAIETKTKTVSEIAGVGRQLPVTMAAFAVGACSLAGLPLFAGFASKWYLLVGGAGVHPAVPAVLVVSGVLNVAYFWPIVYGAFFESSETADPKPLVEGPLGGRQASAQEYKSRQRLPTETAPDGWESRSTLIAPIVGLAALVVALGVAPDWLFLLDIAALISESALGVAG